MRTPSRFNPRVLAVFAGVGVPIMTAAAFLGLGIGQSELRTSFGEHLTQTAEQTAAAVDTFVFRRIIDVSVLGRVPTIREAASVSTRVPLDTESVRRLDAEWQRSAPPPFEEAGLLGNAASTFLAEVVQQDQIYREILLSDARGRLVAATGRTTDYYQADEAWWQQSFGDGVHGRVTVLDVEWDDSAKVFALEVAVPVIDPDGTKVAGVLKVAADIRELVGLVGNVRVGATGNAVLIREDGSIVFGPVRHDPKAQFFAIDLLRERLQAVRPGESLYRLSFAARDSDGGSRLVGVSPSQIGASYPDLKWLVAVSQSERELFAPVRAQAWALVAALALIGLAGLGLALWFSMQLATPPIGDDLHLVEHAQSRRVDEPADTLGGVD